MVITQVVLIIIFIFVVIDIKIVLVTDILKCQGLASEPVDGTRDELFFDVLAQLIVKLEALLDL